MQIATGQATEAVEGFDASHPRDMWALGEALMMLRGQVAQRGTSAHLAEVRSRRTPAEQEALLSAHLQRAAVALR